MVRNLCMLFLLSAGLLLIGCAAVMQTEPNIGEYFHLLVGHKTAQHTPSIEILQIQKKGDTDIYYNPSPNNGFLWLRPGEYTVKLKCNSKPWDKGYVVLGPAVQLLPEDSNYSFDIEDDFYGLDCEVSDNGQIFIRSGKVLMVN